VTHDGVRRSGLELLGHPGASIRALAAAWPELGQVPAEVAEQVEIEARYRPYLRRQEEEIGLFRREDGLKLPAGLDYAGLAGLSAELRLALGRHRPESIGMAARIPGMTPAALTLLYRHARKAA
jgi:tRNA uridine 5-carboxymethylaminomethyl modification enzyme